MSHTLAFDGSEWSSRREVGFFWNTTAVLARFLCGCHLSLWYVSIIHRRRSITLSINQTHA